jgi:AcrR family transcriptional regulator
MPRSAPTPPAGDLDTRRRLLETAAEIFADHGYRAATVREICSRASANVAAVNYHFGDKAGLYQEVLESLIGEALGKYPPDLGLGPDPTPEERLEAFVRSFLLRVLTADKPAYLMRLMSREMFEPTDAFEGVVERVHRPLFGRLVGIVGDLAGEGVDPLTVVRCAQAVVGQCLLFKHAEALMKRMGFPPPTTPEDIEPLVHQVTRFSLAGIRRRAQDARGEPE